MHRKTDRMDHDWPHGWPYAVSPCSPEHAYTSKEAAFRQLCTPSRAASIVVAFECLKEISVGSLPCFLAHVHLAAALPNSPHDPRVRNSTFDTQGLIIQLLQLLEVLLSRIHLNFDCINLQQECSLFQVWQTICCCTFLQRTFIL